MQGYLRSEVGAGGRFPTQLAYPHLVCSVDLLRFVIEARRMLVRRGGVSTVQQLDGELESGMITEVDVLVRLLGRE